MLIKYIIVLLISGFFFNKANTADSDGKEFVFAFLYENFLDLSTAATTTVIVIPSYNDSVCSFKYTQNSDFQVVVLQEKAIYGKTNEFTLNIKEVVVRFGYHGSQFYNGSTKDFRVFASCTEEVKLIGKIGDPVNAWGDQFLIPSLKNAGTQYTFAMPKSDYYEKGTVAILPVNKEGSISVNIVGYVNGALFSNKTVQYDMTLGQNQRYISSWFKSINDSPITSDWNTSIAITTSSKVMLSFEAPLTTTSNLDGSCGIYCYGDFVQFMPIASQPIGCNSSLLAPDQRMITSHFTTRLHLSPPNSGINCNAISKITVYEDTNNVQGSEQVVDKMGYTQISLMGKQSAAFSTYDGQMSTNRFGSTFEQDNSTADGHFMHYVPSTSEWVTGKTQFHILAKDCILELYADAIGSNPDIIKIDGHNISTLKYERKFLPFFKMQYAQFIVQMKGYGLHTIENDGNYVAFVICKKVNGSYNAYGYLTGFNQRKPN